MGGVFKALSHGVSDDTDVKWIPCPSYEPNTFRIRTKHVPAELLAITGNCLHRWSRTGSKGGYTSVAMVPLEFVGSDWVKLVLWPSVRAPDDRWVWSIWWNENRQGKPMYSEKNLPHCNFVHHKPHTNLTGISSRPPRWEAGDKDMRHGTARHGTARPVVMISKRKTISNRNCCNCTKISTPITWQHKEITSCH
jgi:hypothetical protein